MSEGVGELALELEGITKTYRGRAANRDVTLRVRRGTIHAVVGENGAGKSTLLRIAYGATRADAGRIRLFGQIVPLPLHSPARALASGVGMVHQHFMLVPTLTVLENVVLGREPHRGPILDLARARPKVEALARRLSLVAPLDTPVGDLPVGDQQRVEILKILWRGAEMLLLDEPTAVLTPPEVAALFGFLRGLVAEGKTVVLVTHRLDEVTQVADAVTVLRRGEVVAELPRGADRRQIARAMLGGKGTDEADPADPGNEAEREDPAASGDGGAGAPDPDAAGDGDTCPRDRDPLAPSGRALGELVLEVCGLSVGPLDDVSFSLRAGEVLGVAGVFGNGQTELFEAIAGLRRVGAGSIRLAGVDVTRAPVRERLARGLGHVPEDRHRRGLILDFTLAENLVLGRHRELGSAWRLDRERMVALARERLVEFDVRPCDPQALAAELSGGNQQKVVVARELGRPGLRALLCAEPTRGVDVGAARILRQRIRAAAASGVGVLLMSSELDELRALADRLIVLYKGRIVASLPVAAATDDVLAPLMTGAAGAAESAGGWVGASRKEARSAAGGTGAARPSGTGGEP